MRRGDEMARTIRQSPNSGTTTAYSPGEWARRVVATLALGLLFTITASEARAGIAFVKNLGTQTGTSNNATTLQISVPAGGVAAGNSIILTFVSADLTGAFSATDSVSNTYSVDIQGANTGKARTVILSAHNVKALVSGNTITVTYPLTSAKRVLSANEFSGLAKTGTLDQTSINSGTGTTADSLATAITAQAAELLVGAI